MTKHGGTEERQPRSVRGQLWVRERLSWVGLECEEKETRLKRKWGWEAQPGYMACSEARNESRPSLEVLRRPGEMTWSSVCWDLIEVSLPMKAGPGQGDLR